MTLNNFQSELHPMVANNAQQDDDQPERLEIEKFGNYLESLEHFVHLK